MKRSLLLLCLAAWLVRVPFITATVLQNADETWALTAASAEGAAGIRDAATWADRWSLVERTSAGGRILWIVNFYLLGNVCPGPEAAYALNLLFSLLALVFLAAAARRMAGEEAWLLCWILGSFSPYLLHYGFRVVGTMPSVMWITLALLALTGPASRVRTWAAAGLAFGLAFTTHYGVGPVILGLTAGAALSLTRSPDRRCGDPDRALTGGPGRGGGVAGEDGPGAAGRLGRIAAAAIGALVALIPPALLELWARHAGSSYVKRLFSHERLGEDVAGDLSGPYGLFVRHYLEIDPLLSGLAIAGVVSGLSAALTARGKTRWRGPLASGALIAAALAFVPIARYPPVGSWLVGLTLTVVAAVALRSLAATGSAAVTRADVAGTGSADPALSSGGLLLALAVSALLFVLFRPLSAMSRLSFTLWPLLALAVTTALARRGPAPLALRRVARLGAPYLALALVSLQRGKAFDAEAERFAAEHPTWKRLHYIAFVRRDLEDGLGILARDRPETIVPFGPPRLVTPVTFFDEEPFKLLDLQQKLPALDIPRKLAVDDVVYAWIFYPPD